MLFDGISASTLNGGAIGSVTPLCLVWFWQERSIVHGPGAAQVWTICFGYFSQAYLCLLDAARAGGWVMPALPHLLLLGQVPAVVPVHLDPVLLLALLGAIPDELAI